MNSEDGAVFMESSSSWSRTSLVGALTFSPSEVRIRSWSLSDPDYLHLKSLTLGVSVQFFGVVGVEDLKLQRPALTSTPVCSVKHSTNTKQDDSCLHCSDSRSTRYVGGTCLISVMVLSSVL